MNRGASKPPPVVELDGDDLVDLIELVEDEESLAKTSVRVPDRIPTLPLPSIDARVVARPTPSSIPPTTMDVAQVPSAAAVVAAGDSRWIAAGGAVLFASIVAAVVGIVLAGNASSRDHLAAAGAHARTPHVAVVAAAREEITLPPLTAPAKDDAPVAPSHIARARVAQPIARATAAPRPSRPSGFGHMGSVRH